MFGIVGLLHVTAPERQAVRTELHTRRALDEVQCVTEAAVQQLTSRPEPIVLKQQLLGRARSGCCRSRS